MSKFVPMIVYGTLMSGESNHRYMANSELVGTVKFKGELYCLGGFPALMEGKGTVVGELYRVPIEDVPNIDMLEGFDRLRGQGMYVSKEIDLIFHDESVTAQVYYWNMRLPRDAMKWRGGKKWSKKEANFMRRMAE